MIVAYMHPVYPTIGNTFLNKFIYISSFFLYRDLSKHECVCDTGYYGDGYVCVEEINCRNTPNLCDVNAKCTTQSTGLQCICNPGKYSIENLNFYKIIMFFLFLINFFL